MSGHDQLLTEGEIPLCYFTVEKSAMRIEQNEKVFTLPKFLYSFYVRVDLQQLDRIDLLCKIAL